MATGTIVYSKEELFEVLKLSPVFNGQFTTLGFVAADIPDVTAEALAEAYLDLVVSQKANTGSFGKKLQKFANEQVPVVRAAIEAVEVAPAPVAPTEPEPEPTPDPVSEPTDPV